MCIRDSILSNIDTTVSGDTLSINSKGSYNTRIGVKVNISVPMLEGVSVSGSGDIHVTGLTAGDMDAGVTGSGDVTLSGVVDRLSGQITGSGDLRAGDLAAKHVRVKVTGSGLSLIHICEHGQGFIGGRTT